MDPWELLMQTCWPPLSDHWSVQATSPHLSGFVFCGCLKAYWTYLRYDMAITEFLYYIASRTNVDSKSSFIYILIFLISGARYWQKWLRFAVLALWKIPRKCCHILHQLHPSTNSAFPAFLLARCHDMESPYYWSCVRGIPTGRLWGPLGSSREDRFPLCEDRWILGQHGCR